MSVLTEAIHAEIKERRARNPGRPDRELLEHILVAVQRERVVAVGFDSARIGERLARSPLPEEAKQLMSRAVGQIWLDENMHARYLIGLLDRQAELGVQLDSIQQSLEGGVAGWAVSVKQLSQWKEAPGQRGLATMIELAGRIAGKVPDEIRVNMVHLRFADYCRFNADAEESAAVSFARMKELCAEVLAMPGDPGPCVELPPGFDIEIGRMGRDEVMHQRVFEAFASLLGEDDGLLPGKTVDDLVSAVSAIDGWLVPAALLGKHAAAVAGAGESPVGKGGAVTIGRGKTPAEKFAVFDNTLDIADFFEHIDRRAQATGKPRAEVIVAIKPDLMMAYHKNDKSTFTDPALVERLIDALHEHGYRDLRLCESQNLYGRFFGNRGVAAVAEYVGYRPERYRIVDLGEEAVPHDFTRGMGLYDIGRSWKEADVRISFAKLKTHVNATASLTIRNVSTVIPQRGDYLFTGRLSQIETVMMAILHDLPPHYGIIDGYEFAADGMMGFIADPTPKHPYLIIAGADVMCVDYVAIALMGERDPLRALDLRTAVDWFGDPRAQGYVLGDMTPIPDWDRAVSGPVSAPLAALSASVYAALSGQGSYFMPDMDTEAFPPIGETGGVAAIRGAVRTMLGFRRAGG
ncbi:MAG: DUF362 domain-containing protein [Minicystis sp.]